MNYGQCENEIQLFQSKPIKVHRESGRGREGPISNAMCSNYHFDQILTEIDWDVTDILKSIFHNKL